MLDGHQVLSSKPVVEKPKSRAKYGFRLLAISAIERVRQVRTRTPVVVIGDVVLCLPAQPPGEREPVIYLYIVLCKYAEVKNIRYCRWITGCIAC